MKHVLFRHIGVLIDPEGSLALGWPPSEVCKKHVQTLLVSLVCNMQCYSA